MTKIFAHSLSHILTISGLILLVALPSNANQAQHDVTVFIECTKQSGKPSTGSGVIVSATGHVLTARHVIAGTKSCSARIGSRLSPPIPIHQVAASEAIPAQIDAIFMQIEDPSGESYPFARTCRLSPKLDRQFITSLAYSRNSKERPSATRGIVANTTISPKGIVEVDLHLSRQRSGGPIFLEGQTAIIGVVTGVTVDPLQLIADTFNMTAVNPLIDVGGILSASPHCDDLPSPAALSDAELASWKSLEPGNCADLKRHLSAFPNGGYSKIAQALLLSVQISTVDKWKLGSPARLKFHEFKHSKNNETEARALLEAAISENAQAECDPVYGVSMQPGGEPSAEYDVTCTASASGVQCNADGRFICPVMIRHIVETRLCGEASN